MATYAIGDIQGCFGALDRLMAEIRFDPSRDRLWLVGDLVNRGPDSLSVLRWVKGLGEAAVTVLGNHDLHLLARAHGISGPKKGDTLDDVLAAPDHEDLIAWLQRRPVLHRAQSAVLVHAGLLPEWTVAQAEAFAHEVEGALRRDPVPLLRAVYADSAPAGALERVTAALRVFSRLRACTEDGRPDFRYKGPLEEMPAGLTPWFAMPGRRSAGTTVIFGHWAALGFRLGSDYIGLDSGCVWGRSLTAIRLEDRRVFYVSCTRP